ncbi:MAG TPA: hypothetical protein VF576_03540 [Rubricoccaceae bacterium]|jgi:hypothetical protein
MMARATHRLTGVDVRYISIAGRPKNWRTMLLRGDLVEVDVVVERETGSSRPPRSADQVDTDHAEATGWRTWPRAGS